MLSDKAKDYFNERSMEVLHKSNRIQHLSIALTNSTRVSAELLDDMYTDMYKHELQLLGYTSFNNAFIHLNSIKNDEFLVKGGNKDLSKLTAKKKTVMRNGKPVVITVYEDDNKEEEDTSGGKGRSSEQSVPRASELKGSYTTDKKKAQKMIDGLKGSTLYGHKKTATLFLTVFGQDKQPVAVIGYKKFGHYLKLVSINVSEKSVQGVLDRAFYELVKLAIPKKLGIIVDKKISGVLPFKKMYNMDVNDRDDDFLSYEDLKKAFGDYE